ncbi:hypothetical protein B0O80DRAFT_437792 [Mortierella sp. GBAus27b]|nr:hypothetical protein B0O80DRAFT_437792 [Mortierella sp. GBAus27b]
MGTSRRISYRVPWNGLPVSVDDLSREYVRVKYSRTAVVLHKNFDGQALDYGWTSYRIMDEQ